MNPLTLVKSNHPALRSKTVEIDFDAFTKADIEWYVNQMIDIMKHNSGIGLAAPQVGFDGKLFIFREPDGSITTVINPVIVRHGKQTDYREEGCLSFPGERRLIERWNVIDVEYYNADGKLVKRTFKGFQARVFQHEFDHLQGVCIVKS